MVAKKGASIKKSAFEARHSGDADPADRAAERIMSEEKPAFRKPGEAATLPELIKFLNDRSGYIRALEEEATPESFSRIENLKELANAAQDAQERGETLNEFLDHAALVSDADSYSAEARVTLMTLHAAKGLEFPLVFLTGMEEGLFPQSRTLTDPTGLEEERRLCYVGMTRAMDTLVMTRARYRRRYGIGYAGVERAFAVSGGGAGAADGGSGQPGVAECSAEYASAAAATANGGAAADEDGERHYSYEDEDQSGGRGSQGSSRFGGGGARSVGCRGSRCDNIANFFGARGQGGVAKAGSKFGRPKLEVRGADGKDRSEQGSSRPAPQIWRGNHLSARRRWGRRQDYSTISTAWREEAGGEVRPARAPVIESGHR